MEFSTSLGGWWVVIVAALYKINAKPDVTKVKVKV